MVEEKATTNTITSEAPQSDYLYLRSANIKEYRTIKDCSIDFQPGLNIIIGKNGVGKTNFMNALNQAINFAFGEFSFGEATLKLYKDREVNVVIPGEGTINERNEINGEIQISTLRNVKVDGKEIGAYFHDSLVGSFLSSSIIRHGIPLEQLLFIKEPLTLEITDSGKISFPNIFEVIFSRASAYPYFLKSILVKLNNNSFNNITPKVKSNQPLQAPAVIVNADNFEQCIAKTLSGIFDNLTNLNDLFKRYTPIQQVHANRNVLMYFDKEKVKAIAKNLTIEFEVNGSVLPFESLSDGTKRMFYIVAEVATESWYYFGNGIISAGAKVARILLVEEPELGIHPHQLQLLMDFLKEQSQYKQIIVTTHSPQVLDILKSDELNRVIIASHSREKGTQLRHLTEKEEAKAKNYMSETGFLSDYWKYSDLESN